MTFLLAATPAFAFEDFSTSQAITASVLSSTVTGSQVMFGASSFLNYGDNFISGDAFKEALGVIAISQNTGINSNIEQAVTVQVGSVVIDVSP